MFNPDAWKHELLVSPPNTSPNSPLKSPGQTEPSPVTSSESSLAPKEGESKPQVRELPKAVSFATEPMSNSMTPTIAANVVRDPVPAPQSTANPPTSDQRPPSQVAPSQLTPNQLVPRQPSPSQVAPVQSTENQSQDAGGARANAAGIDGDSAECVIPISSHQHPTNSPGSTSPASTSPGSSPAAESEASLAFATDAQNPPILRIDERVPEAASTELTEQASLPDTPAIQIVASLLKSSHLLRAFLSEHFAEFGLSDIRYTVMRRIHQSGECGCSQAELARELNQSESSISTLIDRMRNDGLIYRLRSQNDRRKRVLLLSDEGRQRFSRARSCHGERMAQLIEPLSEEQVQVLQSSLDLLTDQLSETRHNEPARPEATRSAA